MLEKVLQVQTQMLLLNYTYWYNEELSSGDDSKYCHITF